MEFLTFDREQIWKELISRGREQGIMDQEGYDELVDSVLTELLQVGEAHDDQNMEEHIAEFRGRWPEYQAEVCV